MLELQAINLSDNTLQSPDKSKEVSSLDLEIFGYCCQGASTGGCAGGHLNEPRGVGTLLIIMSVICCFVPMVISQGLWSPSRASPTGSCAR